MKHRKLGVAFSKGSPFKPDTYLLFMFWWIAISYSFTYRKFNIEKLWRD